MPQQHQQQQNPAPRGAHPTFTSRLSTIFPASGSTTTTTAPPPPPQKPRQVTHLAARLAQLAAHVADLETLLRMTSVQAACVQSLGAYTGAL
ncbi:MAG: hypothetical protein M1829_000319 [Trizodia sp. TS-e1964]|nr:MAG: hypothetical protein M1829_000319 [Trizodia sp. TS-e1964]